jgi:hypothetical protein
MQQYRRLRASIAADTLLPFRLGDWTRLAVMIAQLSNKDFVADFLINDPMLRRDSA